MSDTPVRERLAAVPVRGLGCAAEVAAEAVAHAGVMRELVGALADHRAAVVARAANALKKAAQASPGACQPFAAELVRAALVCEVLEARWSLWLVVGGLRLTGRQRALAVDGLFGALCSVSALERVGALQALADLSVNDEALHGRMRSLVARAMEDGSAAVRARARRLWVVICG